MGRDRSGSLLSCYSSSGGWLIRESTNQAGQYVLSVNWHGTPRHMRLMLDHRGCRISNLLFADVPRMLAHFHQTPFPIDSRMVSESTDPFRLKNFVSRVRACSCPPSHRRAHRPRSACPLRTLLPAFRCLPIARLCSIPYLRFLLIAQHPEKREEAWQRELDSRRFQAPVLDPASRENPYTLC